MKNLYIILTLFCTLAVLYRIFKIKTDNLLKLSQIALFSSIATIGRCFMFFIPNFNPFLPTIILSSANMDKNYGFLIGSLSIFVSNIFLGQGLWTPWQMLAAGSVGYLSGLLFFNKKIRPTITKLVLFSIICIVFIYSAIMNISSLLLLINSNNLKVIFTYFFSFITIDSLYAALSTTFTITLYNPIVNTVRKFDKISER